MYGGKKFGGSSGVIFLKSWMIECVRDCVCFIEKKVLFLYCKKREATYTTNNHLLKNNNIGEYHGNAGNFRV